MNTCIAQSKEKQVTLLCGIDKPLGGQSSVYRPCVHSLKRAELKGLSATLVSQYNRDALCMCWNETDLEGLCAEDNVHTWNSDQTPCSWAI